ncbi:MAG: hypothetical protein ACI8P3_003232 [Saprospiraceae bacterium]|jgi:hypothetical protein
MNQSGKIILMLIVFMATLTIAPAQRDGSWNSSPEETAAKQTTMMADSLSLSDAQKEKVAEVNLLYANKMSAARTEARKNSDGDWEAMRETMRATMTTIRTEQKTALQKYLTSEQAEKWEKIETAQQAKRRGKGGKGRKNGKGKKQTEQKT